MYGNKRKARNIQQNSLSHLFYGGILTSNSGTFNLWHQNLGSLLKKNSVYTWKIDKNKKDILSIKKCSHVYACKSSSSREEQNNLSKPSIIIYQNFPIINLIFHHFHVKWDSQSGSKNTTNNFLYFEGKLIWLFSFLTGGVELEFDCWVLTRVKFFCLDYQMIHFYVSGLVFQSPSEDCGLIYGFIRKK